MELKVLIADDDSGMRLVLKKALEKVEELRLVGEAEDGEAALRIFEAEKPHLVFLDVEMPGFSGLECAKRIVDINPKTFVVFATAHSEYMPEAFELYAFDYLVKPFKLDRIYQTIERVKALSEQRYEQPIDRIIRQEKGLDKLLIKNKDGISFVDMKDIIMIQRENRTTVVYTEKGSYTTSDGLTELEGKLDGARFFRSHKSYIINLSAISKIYPYGRWTYIIKFNNTDMDALLTHERFQVLEKIFYK